MPIMNYTTSIDVNKTMGEINAALARRGVTRISALYDDAGAPAGLAFTMRTDFGLHRDFELPIRTDGVLAAFHADPKVPKASRNRDQAARTAWRIAKDWLESQAALIDARLATLDEVMMPYMVAGYEEDRAVTMYGAYRTKQLAINS